MITRFFLLHLLISIMMIFVYHKDGLLFPRASFNVILPLDSFISKMAGLKDINLKKKNYDKMICRNFVLLRFPFHHYILAQLKM
jgi:hypothetical protein